MADDATTSSPELSDCTRLGLALRVPSFAVTTTGLGILAHLAGGGRPPDLPVLTVLLAATGLLGRAMAAAEQSLARLAGTLLWVQLAIHVGLAVGSPAAAGSDCHADRVTAVVPGAAADAAAGGAALDPFGPLTGHALHASPWMWLAHTLAALAVAVWLRRGEAACWRAVRRVVARLLPTAAPTLTAAPRTTWVDDAGDARPDPIPVLLGHRWRGPPRALRTCP